MEYDYISGSYVCCKNDVKIGLLSRGSSITSWSQEKRKAVKPDEHRPEQMIDITGPRGKTLFCEPKSWLIAAKEQDIQAHIDERWRHYGEAKDDRLVALIGALCIESSIDSLLIAAAPGFPQYLDDTAFTFSVKTKMAESFRLLPTRILNACDLVRQVRNQFAHDLDKKRFEDLDDKSRRRLEPCVRAFDNTSRSPDEPQRLFKELVSYVLIALKVYTEQVSRLRSYVEDEAGMKGFSEWCKERGKLKNPENSG